MSRVKSNEGRKTFHLRMSRAEQRKIAALGKAWGLKSWNAVVIEAINECHAKISIPAQSEPVAEQGAR
jgi:hypothetical protein